MHGCRIGVRDIDEHPLEPPWMLLSRDVLIIGLVYRAYEAVNALAHRVQFDVKLRCAVHVALWEAP